MCCIGVYFVFHKDALVFHTKGNIIVIFQDCLEEVDPLGACDTFGFLLITPGKSATKAMAVSCIMFHQVNMSRTLERLERIAPVCTHMKLYGMRPTSTVPKKVLTGTPRTPQLTLMAQLGDMGNIRRKRRK